MQNGCINVSNVSIIFCFFHVVILSFLDVLQSLYINFISFFGTNLLTQCQLLFLLVFTSQDISTKWCPIMMKLFGDFFWTRRHPVGQRSAREVGCGGHNPPGHARGPPARPDGLCPPRGPPPPPLTPINTQIFRKPQGSRQKTHPAAASSKASRSNLTPSRRGSSSSQVPLR